MNKICNKCSISKPYSEYHKRKDSKDGYYTICKMCKKEVTAKWYVKNKESANKRTRINYLKNQKKYKDKYIENRDEITAKARLRYHSMNIEEKENYRARRNKWHIDNMKNDTVYKLKHNTKSSIWNALNGRKFKKSFRTHKILGCTYNKFLTYLDNNPYGFKYGNENIDLDHIVPMSSVTTEDDAIKLNHYTNFQLLPAEYNRRIKIDNPFDRNHFENYLKEKMEKMEEKNVRS